MDGDAGKPGGECRLAGELVQVFIGADIRILHYVLGLAVIAQDDAGNPVEPLVIAAHQDLKKRRFAREHTGHHFFIS